MTETEADRARTVPMLIWFFLAALGAALTLYGPALHGPFLADDYGYVANNVYIQTLDLAHLRGALDPSGAPALFTANYAPVHMLACMLEWHFFGSNTFGYHVVNVIGHAVVATLIVAFFLSAGIPRWAAVFLGAVFLVHPANVEAVAWIFQLKTILALGFAVGALLLFRRHPLLASVLFALALLSKISSAFALPVLVAQLWVDREEGGVSLRGRWPWLLGWVGLFALAGWPEFAAFARYGNAPNFHPYPDLASHVRSIFAVGGRYLVMAFTSFGTSAFQEPPPSGWGDPWWISGFVLLLLLGWRSAVALLRRSEEAVYWVWAAASFAPVSQIFPFPIPVGDRYLYMILPGLLGGGFLLGRDVAARLGARWGTAVRHPAGRLAAVAALAAAAVCALLVWHAAERAALWRSDVLLYVDAATHYPEGQIGTFLDARDAASAGNADAAVADLQRLAASGYDDFQTIANDPVLSSLGGMPAFHAVIEKVAGNWIVAVSNRKRLLQPELRTLALAHLVRGETDQAIQAYEEALRQGGPFDDLCREELAQVRQATGG
jgi:hypothetical protein